MTTSDPFTTDRPPRLSPFPPTVSHRRSVTLNVVREDVATSCVWYNRLRSHYSDTAGVASCHNLRRVAAIAAERIFRHTLLVITLLLRQKVGRLTRWYVVVWCRLWRSSWANTDTVMNKTKISWHLFQAVCIMCSCSIFARCLSVILSASQYCKDVDVTLWGFVDEKFDCNAM